MLFKKTSKISLFVLLSFVGEMRELFAQQIQEVRKVGVFENIILEGSANTFVYVSQDKVAGIKVKADQQHLNKIKTSVSDGTLTIFLNAEDIGDAKVEIFVNLLVVKKISILGGGNIELIDGSDGVILQTSIQGGGNILIKDEASVHTFQGQISGGGSISAVSLDIKDAKISVTGGGTVLVQVENRLEGSINGGGSILYTGYPEVLSAVTGGGRIARK